MTLCPCGSGQDLDACCAPIMNGSPAPTALTLMRARYTAFATGRIDAFIHDTLAPEMRGDYDPAEVAASAKDAVGAGLEVLAVTGGGPDDETGIVEYVARFRVRGKRIDHHERASFRREDGRWLYVDGEMNPKPPPRHVVKIGRNDPCPCGSGKKYKKCCGA
ncbi:MAG: YchJ family protein [Alphaproteobacteria bacterium]|nr:YchJ family protein [Alphaproteobacteria bacterium]MBF0129354.1 YchJ family protein [Alphaproteobacteria bacterium]